MEFIDDAHFLLRQERDRLLTIVSDHRAMLGRNLQQSIPTLASDAARFVRAGEKVSGFLEELIRRAEFVERETGPGSEYQRLLAAVRDTGRMTETVFVECVNCRELNQVIVALNRVSPGNHDHQQFCKEMLEHAEGIESTRRTREQALRICAEKIQSEADLIATDGCRFLRQAFYGSDDSLEFLYEGSWLHAIAVAAQSLTEHTQSCGDDQSVDSSGTQKRPGCTDMVTLDPPQVTIDGIPYAVGDDVAVYLAEIVAAQDWVSDAEFKRKHPEFGEAARPDKWRKKLPSQIRALLETHRSRGTRWRKRKIDS